jgi:hypothetical protein
MSERKEGFHRDGDYSKSQRYDNEF